MRPHRTDKNWTSRKLAQAFLKEWTLKNGVAMGRFCASYTMVSFRFHIWHFLQIWDLQSQPLVVWRARLSTEIFDQAKTPVFLHWHLRTTPFPRKQMKCSSKRSGTPGILAGDDPMPPWPALVEFVRKAASMASSSTLRNAPRQPWLPKSCCLGGFYPGWMDSRKGITCPAKRISGEVMGQYIFGWSEKLNGSHMPFVCLAVIRTHLETGPDITGPGWSKSEQKVSQ